MAFDSTSIIHTPNRWFQAKSLYRGDGVAEFSNPASKVRGNAICSFNEFGSHKTVLNASTFEPESGFSIYVPGFRPGDVPLEDDFNPCACLTIQTGDGRFTATKRVGISKSDYGPRTSRFSFDFLRGMYESNEANAPRYWVLPLLNFVSPAFAPLARPGAPEFVKHPLRIYPTPDLPSGISPEDEFDVFFHVHRKNRLVGVKLPHGLAFIEALPDYENRVRRLDRGTTRCTITAVMVGDLGETSFDQNNPASWFPLDIVNVLSLATGIRVGSPWLEFRDAAGKLVRRYHSSFGRPTFERGHDVMPEHIYPNTGYLLSKALASPEISMRHLRVVITHLIGAGMRHRSIEDRFLSVCRGFETLCKHYAIENQNLAEILDPHQQVAVTSALNQTALQIDQLRNAELDPVKKSILDQIANRTRSAASKESLFGMKVATVLERRGFPDRTVMKDYFENQVRKPESWEGLISMYRGAAIHEGAFDIGGGKHDVRDIVRVLDHLHDALLRVFLKTIVFDGQYHSPIVPIFRLLDVDWVKPGTSPIQLGYLDKGDA